MTRWSPITIVALTMVVAILAAGIFLVSRPRHHVERTATENMPEEPRPSPAPVSVHAIVDRTPPRAAPRLVVPVVAPPPAEDSGTRRVPEEVAAALKRRALFIAAHKKQLLDEADERAFEVAKVPESTRTAIRQINEEFGKRIQAIPSPGVSGQTAAQENSTATPDGYDAARNARRAAISNLLDPDSARAFEVAERAAEGNLRAHYLRSWSQELRAEAPFPHRQPLEAQ